MKHIFASALLLVTFFAAIVSSVLLTLVVVNTAPIELVRPLGPNEFVPEFYWQDGRPSDALGDDYLPMIRKILPGFDRTWGIIQTESRFIDVLPDIDDGFCNFDEIFVVSKFPIKEVGRNYDVITLGKFPYMLSSVNKKPGAIYIQDPVIIRIEYRSTGIEENDGYGGKCLGHTEKVVRVK